MRQESCADRIAQELLATEAAIKAELEAGGENTDFDDYFDTQVTIYGITRREVISLQLSGGGPADFIEITTEEGEIKEIHYLFSDWFDSARVLVSEDSPIYQWAAYQLEAGIV